MDRHHHAYAHTGRAFTDGERLKGLAPSTYPPFMIQEWLTRPASNIAETFTDVDLAAKWLRAEMEAHPPMDVQSFGIDARMRHVVETLGQERGADVVWGYYCGKQMVSRAMISCAPGASRVPCPEGRK
ncbi:hypothetical protein [Streptomyces sp. NBC_01207]|uniref:hypothetical protein n=1 Tax=Streptomyces sp. NBC_01207 TaxID=2903772 RepID=UPI002E156BF7|nr:hypothetical protein OG457_27620 [Streptomyces sp. NBC_01207]